MVVKVLGSGCPSCKKLLANTEKAVKKSGVDAEVVYVTDMQENRDNDNPGSHDRRRNKGKGQGAQHQGNNGTNQRGLIRRGCKRCKVFSAFTGESLRLSGLKVRLQVVIKAI
jgi:hypothetical protein